MNKKDIINIIKQKAKDPYSGSILLCYKGECKAVLQVPEKDSYWTWQEYLEQYEIEPNGRNKGEYFLTIKLRRYGSYISVLIDNIREV